MKIKFPKALWSVHGYLLKFRYESNCSPFFIANKCPPKLGFLVKFVESENVKEHLAGLQYF